MTIMEQDLKVFHVSDVHFGAEDPAALAWFHGCVATERPDAVIMTGDLTMRARSSEFADGAAWLQSLDAPVTVEVGNHDIPYYSNPLGRLFHPYKRYAALERMIERPLNLPGIVVVPLKTIARAQWRLNWSKGRVDRSSLADAVRLLRQAPADAVKFVAAHHPLIEAGTRSTGRTHGGGSALAALADAGAHAVLSGHVHDPFDIPFDRHGWTVRLIGAGTLSKRTRTSPPAFNEIRIDGQRFETLVRTLSEMPKRSISQTTAAGA